MGTVGREGAQQVRDVRSHVSLFLRLAQSKDDMVAMGTQWRKCVQAPNCVKPKVSGSSRCQYVTERMAFSGLTRQAATNASHIIYTQGTVLMSPRPLGSMPRLCWTRRSLDSKP